MAHEITSRDSFGFVGQPAWHGLGVELEEDLTALEAFQQLELDWTTQLAPVFAEVTLPDGSTKKVRLDDTRAHFRNAKSMDDLPVSLTDYHLGNVGPEYQAFSNQSMAEFADALAGIDKNISIETAGSLRGGRRVFALVKLPKDIKVVSRDVVQQFVLLSNAHDGSSRFHCYPTSVRVVCANTLRWSEKDVSRGISFQHTGDIEFKVAEAQRALGIILRESEQYEQQIRLLAKSKVTSDNVLAYFGTVWDATYGKFYGVPEKMAKAKDGNQDKKAAARKLEKAQAAKAKHLEAWKDMFDNPKQRIRGIEGTLWAAFNAVSEWQDHGRGRLPEVTQEGGSPQRVHSNLFGVSHQAKGVAWRRALVAAR